MFTTFQDTGYADSGNSVGSDTLRLEKQQKQSFRNVFALYCSNSVKKNEERTGHYVKRTVVHDAFRAVLKFELQNELSGTSKSNGNMLSSSIIGRNVAPTCAAAVAYVTCLSRYIIPGAVGNT